MAHMIKRNEIDIAPADALQPATMAEFDLEAYFASGSAMRASTRRRSRLCGPSTFGTRRRLRLRTSALC